jgi:membrane protease YdiL (CAAX protease family)
LASLLRLTDRWVLPAWGAYLALPLIVAARDPAPLPPARLMALLLALTLPPSLRLLPPVGTGFLTADQYPLTGIIAAGLGLSIVLVYRPTPGFGYGLRLPGRQIGLVIASFASFGALAIPLGWFLGFLAPGIGVHSPIMALVRAIVIFFGIALPEELAFRGLLQQSLEQFAGARAGLVAASVVFGLSHLGHPPTPNWRYGLLATLAGLAYGQVYQRTRSITASALTHALVDWTWVAVFAGRAIH